MASSGNSAPDTSKLLFRQKVNAVSSVQERIAAFEGNQQGAANTTISCHNPKPDYEKRFTATLTLNMKPSSLTVHSFKPDETQRDADPSVPPRLRKVLITSAVNAYTAVPGETNASLASAEPAWMNDRRLESTTILRPESQKPNAPSFPKVHQSTKLSWTQQNRVTKEQSLTDDDDGAENSIRTKPPNHQETQKPDYFRTYGTQNKLWRDSTNPTVPKRSLQDVLALGNPPPKPNRPPRVDIHRFKRNYGPGMKIPHPVASLLPPLHSGPSSNHAAALSQQQLDEDEGYDDIGIMNAPPLPERLSKKKEEPKGTINSEEMKGEKNVRKLLKQQTAKEKRDQEANKFFKIKEPAHVIKKGLADFKRGHDDLKEDEDEPGPRSSQSEAESDIYDDILPAEVCSGLNVQNLGEDDIYDEVYNNPDTRVSPLPQDEDNVYDDIYSQSSPLPLCGYDIYDEVKEECIYEIE